MPIIVRATRANGSKAYAVKYNNFNTPGMRGYEAQRYALKEGEIALVVAGAADQATLDTIAADPEVTRLATQSNWGDSITNGQANQIKSLLEGFGIPAQWVSGGMTRAQIIKTIVGIFQLNQRLEGIAFNKMRADFYAWVDGGGLGNVAGHESDVNLSINEQRKIAKTLQWQELPTGAQNYLIAMRDKNGWSNTDLGLTATSTVNEIIKAMTGQGFGIRRRLAKHGLTLDSQYSTFPQGWKNELVEIVESFGLTPAELGLTGTSSLRDFLKAFADTRVPTITRLGQVDL